MAANRSARQLDTVTKRNPSAIAADQLDSLMLAIKATKGKPTTELMSWIGDHIRNTRDVLLEPDPVRQRADMIVIALRQSTRITERMVFGSLRQTVDVIDEPLYAWACASAHQMPARFA